MTGPLFDAEEKFHQSSATARTSKEGAIMKKEPISQNSTGLHQHDYGAPYSPI